MSSETNAPHLVFVGLAGSGKTTVGRGVAGRLGREFLDLDQEILNREGKATVGEVFRSKGEAWFRQVEAEITRELAGRKGMVVSPGGGWIMTPGSLEAVRRVSYLIYLKVSPERALERIGADRGNRPLLDHPDPVGELRRQLEIRGPRYEEADFIVDAETIGVQEVIDLVIERFR